MDTRVCLLEKYFPLMLQTPLLLSVRKRGRKKTERALEEKHSTDAQKEAHTEIYVNSKPPRMCEYMR